MKDGKCMGWMVLIIGILYLLPLMGVSGEWTHWVLGILVVIIGLKMLMCKGSGKGKK